MTGDNLQARVQELLAATHVVDFEVRGAGMSRVFVAQDIALKRKVAVKVMNPSLAAAVSIERFQREIMIVAKLNHPNIVPVLSAGELDGLPFFIMPFIEGESLRGRVIRGPMSIRETVAILKDAMRALSYAHSVGIVHRDLKPDNILLAGSAAMVADFGVAKAISASRERGAIQPGQPITGVGISLGTPQYMAPEQAAADPNADHRIDIYAIGIVAYEMLVGSPPFHGRTPQALLAAQLTELPPPLAARRYDVPVALSDLVMQCLEKNPEHRPRSATDAVRVLESAEVLSGPVAALPQAKTRRRMRAIRAALSTGLFVLALAAFAAWQIWWPRGGAAQRDGAAQSGAVVPLAVTVLPVSAIGTDNANTASALTSAIEAALVRAGVQVFRVLPDSVSAPRILVESSVQRAGQRMRAHIRVSGPGPGDPLWSDQVDFRADSSFAAQDTVAARIVRAIMTRSGRP